MGGVAGQQLTLEHRQKISENSWWKTAPEEEVMKRKEKQRKMMIENPPMSNPESRTKSLPQKLLSKILNIISHLCFGIMLVMPNNA